jgi:DNA-directed RNA polymerase specialized sigma24 family protein
VADEGELFEGLRLGSRRAFEALLDDDDPTMRRLALLYVPEAEVAALVRRTWAVALPGLDMFTWHTTLRAWLVGILVTYGRAGVHATAPVEPVTTPSAAPARRGTADPTPWATLAWSDRWSTDSWQVLEDALAAQPLERREVLWLHDVEGWPWREVLDACGATAAQGADLLRLGRTELAQVVAAHVGADPADSEADLQVRLEGVSRLLAALRPVHAGRPVDPELVRVFTTWRRHRPSRAWQRWRWDLSRTVRADR